MSDQSAATKAPSPPRGEGGLASRLRVTLLRTSRRLRAERSAGLSESTYAVLANLVVHGPMSPGELAEREHVRPPTMTRTIHSLVDEGLVQKSPHPTDRRQVVVTATTTGEQLVKETRRRRDQWLNRRLASLTSAERQTLSDAEEIMRRIYTR